MRRLVLVGNPNVGKSAIFSRLTGAMVIAANYPGSTVEYTQGSFTHEGETCDIIDVPGTYALEGTCAAEEVAAEVIRSADLIVNVVDATSLERNLRLTLQLAETGLPLLVVLNLWDEAASKGVRIDIPQLEHLLGVPVVPVCGLSGEGIPTLVQRLHDARPLTVCVPSDARWQTVGEIVDQVQQLTHRHPTLLERFETWSVIPWTGIPLAVLVMGVAFEMVRWLGEGLIRWVLDPLFAHLWTPVMLGLFHLWDGTPFLQTIFIGHLINGQIDFTQSMGVLTTGFYVPLVMVLPYVMAFYAVLGLLEDTGYLPRLGILMDTFMHRMGLHGLTIIPMLLGLGCNVPGALATRIFETRRQRFVAAVLMAICVPCMGQSAMVVALLGPYGLAGLLPVAGTLMVLWIVLALVFKWMSREPAPELFLEIPPYRVPSGRALMQKLWLRMRQFLVEAVPFVLLGVLLVNILYSLRMVDGLAHLAAPVLRSLLGLPEDAVLALLMGLFRKDLAVGMLVPLHLTREQLIVASVVLTTYFPCIATFIVLFREFGGKGMLKASLLMIGTSLVVGSILHFLL
ncbi:MAG: FeoB small GTPase domain-containing protein [Armatimonadota bacterium]